MSARILLADDDSSLRFVLSQALGKEGYAVRATGNVATLSKWVRDGEGDLVLSDVYMGDECVFDALPAMRAARPNLPVIVMSAQSTVATALSAAGAGAYDYMPKPFDLDELMAAVKRALSGGPDAKARAQASKAEKEERLPLIGRSPVMQEVYRTMARVAGTDLTVLVEGESGAGKERVARAIHDHSRRGANPFVALSLAGLSVAQLERDLFGPDGALTKARGGSLFLEDVDELPSEAQTRLAGLLHAEEPTARPNVRLIAASQRNLSAMVRQGSFRRDLFYLLNVVSIRLPPLRERLDDVGDLARAFLVRARREGLPEKTLDSSAVERLKRYDFPGNVRELENLLRRSAALSPASVITAGDIEAELVGAAAASAEDEAVAADSFEDAVSRRLASEFAAAGSDLPSPGLYDRLLNEVERPLIIRTLEATRGNQIRAAAILGINRNTLRKKIQTLGIRTGRSD
ncbi:MAG: sigma 54-interacting transcriptional regulator [Hyphomonadaceae bacterium]|nr:sigma 54-interacting transcriptional regulator [Hyphomonadaceae bacterium]MBX3510197.1 sigma 54-interacting transcriptional regulator [Hyphomonadaceae bacterium]